MRRNAFWIVWLVLGLTLGCSSSGGGLTGVATQSLMNQLGGMGSMSKLAETFLQTSAADSRLTGLMGEGDVEEMQPKLSNQLCSMLGGGCAAPVSEDQIAQGAQKLTPLQREAVTENFGSSLGGMNFSSALQNAVKQAVAPKLPGVIGALL